MNQVILENLRRYFSDSQNPKQTVGPGIDPVQLWSAQRAEEATY